MSDSESKPSEREPMVDKRAASRMGAGGDAGQANHGGTEDTEIVSDDAGEESELEKLREQAETYHRNWQRSAADFINYKRRIDTEKAEASRFVSAALVINLLPVFDDLDRAVTGVDANLAGLNWVQGVMAIHRKFANLLQAMGVEEVAAADTQFDPALHEAVAKQPGEEGKVLHVVQKGYKLADRVVRPAMVIVGEAPTVPSP